MTDAIIDETANETNRYYEHCHRNKNLMRKWVPIDSKELWIFWGIIIVMEVVQLLEIRDYWSNAEIMNMPLFPSIMSPNRFEMNSRYLCLSDNEVIPT